MAVNKKKNLTKDLILETAVDIADNYGIDKLSMRKVANSLDCGTMSLYNYISNKNELLEEMVDFVLADLEYPTQEGSWKNQMRKLLNHAHSILLGHEWMANTWQKSMPKLHRMKFMNSVLKILSSGDLSDESIYRGYCAVTMHLIGFTQQEISYKNDLGENVEEIANHFIQQLPSDHTYLSDHIRKRIKRTLDDNDFEFVLDLILNGLEQDKA